MAYQNILVEREGKVALITVNRPQALNCLSLATLDELEGALDGLARDPEVRALVITGAGPRSFISGADIGELNALPSPQAAVDYAHRGQALVFKLERFPKPVVMAINGYCLGGGLELAMAGDIRVAADTARFGQPEINLGLIPGFGGTQRLPRRVPRGMAKYMILTGEHLSAQEALRIGLVEKVVPASEVVQAAKALAATLAEKAPVAVRLAKEAIDQGMEADIHRGCALEAANFGLVCGTEDRREGTSAFLEKRKAQWKGR
ncbi:MAG: enoyl-CoA hydratase/isomerase family protein [Acetobacteraceae bacterium]|nr:enoyl-CoA hydratase/isomerase family protein [Acetobacteraceae bacterium]